MAKLQTAAVNSKIQPTLTRPTSGACWFVEETIVTVRAAEFFNRLLANYPGTGYQ